MCSIIIDTLNLFAIKELYLIHSPNHVIDRLHPFVIFYKKNRLFLSWPRGQ